MINLSKHFTENWRTRVGNEPSLKIVEMIMREGIMVQKGKIFGRDKTLSYFWHPDLKIIVSIDQYSNTAVSVLSGNMPDRNQKRRVRQHGYVAMTMHR